MVKTKLIWAAACVLLLQSTALAAFEEKNSLQFMYGISTHSLDLKSDQFTANQSYVQGQGLSVGYVDFSKDGYIRTDVNYSETDNKFLTSSSLTPAEIKVKNQKAEISFLGIASTVDEHKFLRIGLGYSFMKQVADQTSPNVLAVNTEIHALEVKVKYDLYKSHDLVLNVGAGLGLPFRYMEYGVQSGVNVKSTFLNANIDLNYFLSPSWSLLMKLNYSVIQTTSDGSVSRGTLNATERKQTFFLPIGFSYDF